MKAILSIAILSALTMGFTGNDSKTNSYVGHAIDINSKKAIYDEYHEEKIVAGKHTSTITQYKNTKGVVIASRTLNYAYGFQTPDYRLTVNKNGYYEGATLKGNSVRIYNYDVSAKKEVSKTINVPSPVVIDGGFNYLVKNNWANIIAGKTITFNFVVPARLDYYKFRIKKTASFTDNGRQAIKIVMEPDNMLLRSVVDPIKVTYDVNTKRIIRYEGISNIPADGDGNYEISLSYPNLGA